MPQAELVRNLDRHPFLTWTHVLGQLLESPPFGGAVDSTPHLKTAGVGSISPSPSIACTRKVWRPNFSFLTLKGERQGLKCLRSSLHWNCAPGWSELNLNLALRAAVFLCGFFCRIVSGAAT